MTFRVVERAGLRFFECGEDGAKISSERDAVDIVGEAFTARPDWIVIPVARLGEGVLDLKTRLLGEMLQKFVNYRFRVAILGDVSAVCAASTPFADFVREANRGTQIRFAPDRTALLESLSGG